MLPPCVADGRFRNPLYYYYWLLHGCFLNECIMIKTPNMFYTTKIPLLLHLICCLLELIASVTTTVTVTSSEMIKASSQAIFRIMSMSWQFPWNSWRVIFIPSRTKVFSYRILSMLVVGNVHKDIIWKTGLFSFPVTSFPFSGQWILNSPFSSLPGGHHNDAPSGQ